ncbi:low molecular weight protein arginine phosphatase [Natribacillus halophilus]|uniref:Protein tyrosine phosphatase n=1 Tax=Natribacillus halophilus TaxID=549003 RepID=A0A1G8KUZ7_9BACI|nr:low molecular weight protein arginine phosphatase [Natribacillus halophilus]SDI47231.1 protein tyrosine phosphatase [Natribacillus halophilus]
MAVKRILLVCTGNTCRSPMAAALLSSKGKDVEVKSAGMQALSGSPATPHARIVVREHGAALDQHSAERLTLSWLDWADEVWTMTQGQASRLVRWYPDHEKKITTLGKASGFHEDISDPVGGDLDEYRDTARQINKMLEIIYESRKEERP